MQIVGLKIITTEKNVWLFGCIDWNWAQMFGEKYLWLEKLLIKTQEVICLTKTIKVMTVV